MLLCWHCNAPVKITRFDWICTSCGQSGEYTKIAKDWEEGRYWNSPYQKEEESQNV